jgi:hypothetical protein
MIIRKCQCPCGREFAVQHRSNPKQYFSRACAAKNAEHYRPKRYALARGKTKPRARRTFVLCEAA